MVARSERYDLLARLLDYPEQGGYPEAVSLLRPLYERVSRMSREETQELYTRTFDINAVCTLEVGWHIYGEDYARGALLVKMREQLRAMNVPESVELPDHLTHMLRVLGRLGGTEADEMASHYLLPGLIKMLAGMAEGEHPYQALIEAISCVIRSDHDVQAVTPREKRSDPPDWKNRLPVYGAKGCGRQ